MMFYSHAMAEQMNNDIKKYEDKYNFVLDINKICVLRFDGVGMTRAFMANYDSKQAFLQTMKDTVAIFMKSETDIYFAYSYSDEISILLEKSAYTRFKGRGEKLLSIYSSKITAAFYLAARKNKLELSNSLRAFDARIIELPDSDAVLKYFIARQAFAISSNLVYLRNSNLNNYSLDNSKKIIELLKNKGINYEKLPAYEKFGLLYVNKQYQRSFEFLANQGRLKKLIDERKSYQFIYDPSKAKRRWYYNQNKKF